MSGEFHYKRFVMLSSAITCAAAALLVLVYGHRLFTGGATGGGAVFPSSAVYPLRGVDLSRHNGTVDFDMLADSIDFVYLKATEGRAHRDPRFARNYVKAVNAGLRVGAYHFFRFDVDGESQAENLLWVIRRLPLDLPPAIDVEAAGQSSGKHPDKVVRQRIVDMVRVLRAAGHDSIVIYTNKNGLAHYLDHEELRKCGLWISSFTDPPVSPLAGVEWDVWQFSHTGRLPGVDGDVDLNVQNPRRID